MVEIISEQGYPHDNQVLAIVEYFIKVSSSNEGGILIVGKDSQRREYKPKNEPLARSLYVLPSGASYSVAVGSDSAKNHPAIYFPFELNARLRYPEILDVTDFNDEFFSKFDLTLMNEAMQKISLLDAEVERIFKKIAVWGPHELAGRIKNHFWGEMYYERIPALEIFLQAYRG